MRYYKRILNFAYNDHKTNEEACRKAERFQQPLKTEGYDGLLTLVRKQKFSVFFSKYERIETENI